MIAVAYGAVVAIAATEMTAVMAGDAVVGVMDDRSTLRQLQATSLRESPMAVSGGIDIQIPPENCERL